MTPKTGLSMAWVARCMEKMRKVEAAGFQFK